MPFHLKMTGTSSTDNARVKVPHFKKYIFSYNMKNSTEMPSICIFVCMKMFLTAMIKDEHTSNDLLQSDSSFLLRNNMMTNVIGYFSLPAAKSLKLSILHAVYIGSSHCSARLIISDTILKFLSIMYYY